jgi:hypothetical protein
MTEKERNVRLYILLLILIEEDRKEAIELIETFVKNDTEAIKKTFSIMTDIYLNK